MLDKVIEYDCVEWLKLLPKKSVDLFFTSPPYDTARKYGIDFCMNEWEWALWMAYRVELMIEACKGIVAVVCEGSTNKGRWSASPAILMTEIHKKGIILKKPAAFYRFGIAGSGGKQWLRNDWEFIVCCAAQWPLPWSNNTAMGHPPKYERGGVATNRTKSGKRVRAK